MSTSAPQPLQIGQILVQQGVLTEQQAFEIAAAQKTRHKPFGVLAEEMFDVTVEAIEEAWVEQYHRFTGTIDLNEQKVDERALRTIHRRQAWQFQMAPVRFEKTGELLIAADRSRLARAVTFATRTLEVPTYFRIAESEDLRGFLRRHFPMPEVSDELIALAQRMTRDAA
ncbi:MAG: hypothetical protein AAGF84_04290 [Planctomycetota bacterium]